MVYLLSVACQETANMSPDGTHKEAQYGFAKIGTDGHVQPVGSSGGSGETFETVTIDARSGPSSLKVCLFVDNGLADINASASFVRVSLRPAHDVRPTNNLSTSPFPAGKTTDLLQGLLVSDAVSEAGPVTDGQSFGLPLANYAKRWNLGEPQFTGPSGTRQHIEVTVEIVITTHSGMTYYFKVDPEMQIDF